MMRSSSHWWCTLLLAWCASRTCRICITSSTEVKKQTMSVSNHSGGQVGHRFVYTAKNHAIRSRAPGRRGRGDGDRVDNGIRPDPNRRKEELEGVRTGFPCAWSVRWSRNEDTGPG